MSEYRRCYKCKQILSLNCFYKSKRDGWKRECKSCCRVSANTWYHSNLDKAKDSRKQWRKNNQDLILNNRKRYYADNAVTIKQKAKAWQAENPERTKASKAKYAMANPRRQKIKNNGRFIISQKEIMRLYSSPCFYCGSLEDIHLDHVIPISRGGNDSIGNLVPACKPCNLSKYNKTITEWKKYRRDVFDITQKAISVNT